MNTKFTSLKIDPNRYFFKNSNRLNSITKKKPLIMSSKAL
jgi:hypothetical protein